MRIAVGDVGADHAKVWLDGVDVSKDCFLADEENGVVYVFVRDEAGKYVIDHDEYGGPAVKREERRGMVRVEILEP